MSHSISIFSLIYVCNFFISFFVAYLAWQRKSIKGAKELFHLMIATGIWSFFIIFETASTTESLKIFWAKFGYIGAVSTPVLYLFFVLGFTGRKNILTTKRKILLFVIPALTFLLAFTNDFHHLIWSDFSPISPETNMMEFIHGPAFWICYFGYNYILLFISTILLFRHITMYDKFFLVQGFIVLLGSLFPWSASIVYISGINPVPGLDLVPGSMILSGLLFTYAILNVRFLDLAPIAREILVENLTDGILAIDSKNRVQDINSKATEILGIKNKDVLGKNLETISNCPDELIKLITSRDFNDEFELNLNQPKKTFDIIKRDIRNHPGSNLIIIRDITKQKSFQEEIAKNFQQQEILSKVSLNYNSLSDFEEKTNEALQIIGEHTNVSRVYIFEDSPDGSTTSNTFEWCNKGIVPQINELQDIPYSIIPSWKSMLTDPGIVYSENIIELPEDVKAVLEPQNILSIVVLPLLIEGKIFGFIGFDECVVHRAWSKSEIELLRTISNLISNAFMRNKINNELIKRVNEISGIINSIPDQIIIFNKDGKVISFESHKGDKLFAKYVPGRNDEVNTLLDTELSNSFMTAINECITNNSFKFTFSFFHLDEIEHYEARFVLLKHNEVMAIIRNVTEAKEQEKQLQIAKVKAEDASRAKSEFLANVSHEIRTPMNAILGFSEWLHDNVNDQLHKSYLHTILSSGRNLLALINDILDLSKIESGKMVIHMEPMQCSVVIKEIIQVLQQKIDSKNLAVNISIDKSVPNYVYMDEVRFYQILFNIISNAVKFTEKGYIHVSAHATKSLLNNSVNLIVSVEDTGIGINEDQQDKIFLAFTQQSGQSNRHYEGTGLGLSIVSGLLKKLNGEIKLKSKPAKGTTFIIKFNDVTVAEETETANTISVSFKNLLLKECKILIVDDVNFNIQVLKRLISSDHVTYFEANEGQQALDILMNEKPDIIFMDIRMPGLNGYATTEIIKADERLKDIPVVAFTASTMSEEIEMIDNLFDHFLQKPVFKKDVMEVLTKFLSDKFEILQDTVIENTSQVDYSECKGFTPELVTVFEDMFLPEWEKIKNDLIIFNIDDFYRRLADFSSEHDCLFLSQYCKELNMSLQSFDIEEIRIKINEFPKLIERLKNA